jgi:hypothetical protein
VSSPKRCNAGLAALFGDDIDAARVRPVCNGPHAECALHADGLREVRRLALEELAAGLQDGAERSHLERVAQLVRRVAERLRPLRYPVGHFSSLRRPQTAGKAVL